MERLESAQLLPVVGQVAASSPWARAGVAGGPSPTTPAGTQRRGGGVRVGGGDEYLRYGYAAATLAMFFVTTLIVYLQLRILQRWRHAVVV